MTRACSSIHTLRRIAYPGGQGCIDVLHTQAAQSRVQLPAAVGEGHSAMVGEVVLQQHVAVKTTHIRYGDDAAAAERAILRVQHFTLGNIGAEPAVRSAVQTEKRHIAGQNGSLQSLSLIHISEPTRRRH